MKKEEKEVIVSKLREKFSRAKVAVLAEFTGMEVGEVREVKNQLRRVNGEFKVVKNTLAIRAAKGTALEGITAYFKGPIGVALGYDDPVAPAKALNGLVEKQKKLKIKVGVVESQVVDLARLKQISKLPSKEVLIGQLIGRLKSPLYGFAGTLNGVLSKFVRTLQAVHGQRNQSE
ncbi:MAG: 50S ribosomal protein L10 [Candidatus Manganitrophaceae bacterium]